ncbi:MAG TPA: hypothetical protein VEF06_15990, partial [Bryobacteraceae bacterium]|nr:hypothetical protein [Bryobacteraceae bacterium]
TYTGDYTTSIDFGYRCSSAGDCPVVNDHVVSVDLMPHSSNADLDQQIEAAQGNTLPPYNSSLYGPWTRANGAVNFEGSSGHFAFFCNLYSGQGQGNSGGPGWCASVDLSQTPARVVRLVHTLDGTGMPHARWASLHSAQAQTADPNNLGYGLDPLNSNSTTTLFGGPFQAQVVSILMGDGVTWNTNTCLDWLPGAGTTCAAQNYLRTCPPNSAPFIECVTVRLPQGGVCNVAATQYEKTAWPCPWNPNASQYPPMQPGDNAVDLAPFGSTDSEHFRVLSMTPDAGNTLRVVLARNATYDYCAYSPWHGLADPLAVDAPTQFVHQNGWKLTMMPGYINGCGAAVFQQEQTTGNYAEVGRSFIIHSAEGRGPTGGLTIVTSQHVMYDTPFTQISTIPPPPLLNIGEPAFHGNASAIGGQLQSYLDLSQFNAGPSGYDWALDMNPLVACGAEQLGCGVARTLTPVSGTVYKIQSIGSVSASAVTYKVQPMIGWAGRYQLNDVSGPSSSVDSTPYSMCFVLTPGECHAGSAANEIYVNVPTAFDPGYCSASLSWVSVPCVLFGDNAPAGAIRQFGIHANDPNSHTSRFVSEGWSSVGRHYPYTHAVAYPDGNWAMMMGTNSMDGFLMTGFMFSLPPWQESSDSDSDFKTLSAKLPAGLKYAEIEFGYSRYIGPGRSPTNGLFCTSRADNCETATASSETQQGAPFAFASEPGTPVSCASGCTISVPVVGPNLVYYRLRRSDDGRRWVTSDIQALAIP